MSDTTTIASTAKLATFLTLHLPSSTSTTLTITPLYNNILAALCTVIYVQIVMATGSYIRTSLKQAELSRKFIHISAASWIVFWGLFDESHWSWRLNVLVPFAMFFKLFYLGAILKDPNDPETKSMIRTSNTNELLYGPIHFTMLMTWVGLYRYMAPQAIIIMSSMIGDGIAPLLGAFYGKHVYKVPLGNTKTIEGSVAVLGGTIFGCCIFPYILGMEVILTLRQILAFGVLATVVEGCSPGNFDNLALTFMMDFSFERIMSSI